MTTRPSDHISELKGRLMKLISALGAQAHLRIRFLEMVAEHAEIELEAKTPEELAELIINNGMLEIGLEERLFGPDGIAQLIRQHTAEELLHTAASMARIAMPILNMLGAPDPGPDDPRVRARAEAIERFVRGA